MFYRQPFASRPDLVGDSGLGKPGSYLSSSLPDVSSVDFKCSSTSANMSAADSNFGSHDSEEYASSQENVTERIGAPQTELLDGADLDWELDACKAVPGQNDCIINEDLGQLETGILAQPVMFTESIGQRVKRVREHTSTADKETSTLKCDSSDYAKKASQDDSLSDYTGNAVRLNMEQLEFVGDWPSESLEQRGQRSRKSTSQTVKTPHEGMSNFEEHPTKSGSKLVGHFNSVTPNKTEFQKLLDLLHGDIKQITQETTRDLQPLGGDGNQISLVTEAQPVLSDSVLDRMSERSSDPVKSDSHTPSPIKELGVNQDESSKRDSKEPCTNLNTPVSEVMGLGTGSEQKDKPNFVYPSLSSGGEVECSSECRQEKKKVPSRRAGKSCKLALTFTHQSPSSCLHSGSFVTPLQRSELNPSPELLFTTCPSAFAQTEAQDFALLWRINRQKCFEPESDSYTRGIVTLVGNHLRFVPKMNEKESFEHQVIPYRVCHEKSSQVEENDLNELHFKQHSLEILSCHFKHVPKETLEDLYEKCNQDMEWTTNLLLDSGEHLCRDDDENLFDHRDAEEYDLVQDIKGKSSDCQVMIELFETKINSTNDTVIKRTDRNCCENPAIKIPYNTSSIMKTDGEPRDGNDESFKLVGYQPEEPVQRETLKYIPGPFTVLRPNEPVGESKTQKDSFQSELESEVLQTEVFKKLFDGGCKDEIEDRETKEEVNALMLSQLEELERRRVEQMKEKERRGQRKNGPMTIQTLELKLTTELALQLTELFGPVGISPGNKPKSELPILPRRSHV